MEISVLMAVLIAVFVMVVSTILQQRSSNRILANEASNNESIQKLVIALGNLQQIKEEHVVDILQVMADIKKRHVELSVYTSRLALEIRNGLVSFSNTVIKWQNDVGGHQLAMQNEVHQALEILLQQKQLEPEAVK